VREDVAVTVVQQESWGSSPNGTVKDM
jgi:hypothetical protein